jgi:hypothetical protein
LTIDTIILLVRVVITVRIFTFLVQSKKIGGI